MSNNLKINIFNTDSSILFNNIDNQYILIKINNESLGINILNSELHINYYLNNDYLQKNFILPINLNDYNNITSSNFTLNLPNNLTYDYNYYYGDVILDPNANKSIIIYPLRLSAPVIFLGLPNLGINYNMQLNLIFEWKYGSMNDPSTVLAYDGTTLYYVSLNANYYGLLNYSNYQFTLPGLIYKINIQSITNQSGTLFNLYNTDSIIYMKNNLLIYTFFKYYICSWIENLNTYNFNYINNNLINNNDTIIIMIEYMKITSGEQIFNRTDNFNGQSTYNSFYYYNNTTGVETPTSPLDLSQPTDISIVLSLNYQLFNYLNPLNNPQNNYYNTLFFFNFFSTSTETYFVKNISIFDCDYQKYFANTKYPVVYNNIGGCTNNLYDNIIGNDINLTMPSIPNYNYYFIKFDLINLVKLINFNTENDFFYNFTKSSIINFDTLVNYLNNYNIISYSVFTIKNTVNLILNKTNLVPSLNYESKLNNFLESKNLKYNGVKINFDNNITNSILCKITFIFSLFESYTINCKLFLDNYNMKLYNINYDLSNNNKKQLIKLLLLLAANTYSIKIQFYNNINNQISPSNIFNQLLLSKKNINFTTNININSVDNSFTNANINFNINILDNYYILFLYPLFSTATLYDEFIFPVSIYSFKIFKIKGVHGDWNILYGYYIYYIVFQNITELNIFMNYVWKGIFDIHPKTISNYFNFTQSESVTFTNHYDLNNYWIIDNSTNLTPDIYQMKFEIIDLRIDQLYIYGNVSMNQI